MTWRNILEVCESRRAAAMLPALAAILCPFLSARADLIVPVDAGGRIPAAPGTTMGQAVFTFTVTDADPFLPTVDVNLDIVHTWTEDLEIMLTSPTGASVQLFYHRGGVPEFHDFDDTLFDDDAARYLYEGAPPWGGSFKPEEEPDPPQQALGLSKFIGINPNGLWTLTIDDIYVGDYGCLYRYDDGPFETRRDVLSGTYLAIASGLPCQVSPNSLDFGNVIVGQHSDGTFTITNTGGEALSGSVSESCDHYSIISGGGAYDLGPGEAVVVTVRFEPDSLGQHNCAIETGNELCSNVSCTGEGLHDGEDIPAVSDWGLVAMTLLVLTAGTIVFMRRRSAQT